MCFYLYLYLGYANIAVCLLFQYESMNFRYQKKQKRWTILKNVIKAISSETLVEANLSSQPAKNVAITNIVGGLWLRTTSICKGVCYGIVCLSYPAKFGAAT